MSKSEPNRWKGFVLGVMGAVPGMMAMDYYWNVVYSMKSSSQSSSACCSTMSPSGAMNCAPTTLSTFQMKVDVASEMAYQAILDPLPTRQMKVDRVLRSWIRSLMYIIGTYVFPAQPYAVLH